MEDGPPGKGTAILGRVQHSENKLWVLLQDGEVRSEDLSLNRGASLQERKPKGCGHTKKKTTTTKKPHPKWLGRWKIKPSEKFNY